MFGAFASVEFWRRFLGGGECVVRERIFGGRCGCVDIVRIEGEMAENAMNSLKIDSHLRTF